MKAKTKNIAKRRTVAKTAGLKPVTLTIRGAGLKKLNKAFVAAGAKGKIDTFATKCLNNGIKLV